MIISLGFCEMMLSSSTTVLGNMMGKVNEKGMCFVKVVVGALVGKRK